MPAQPVHPDTHPTRIAQAARALRLQLRRECDDIAIDPDPEKTVERIGRLSDSLGILTSMVEALAVRAGRSGS